jgi:hypothetical protein
MRVASWMSRSHRFGSVSLLVILGCACTSLPVTNAIVDAGSDASSSSDPVSVDPSLAADGGGGAAVGGKGGNPNTGSAAASGGASVPVAGNGQPQPNSGGTAGDTSGVTAGASGANGTAGVAGAPGASGSDAAGAGAGTAGQSGSAATCAAGTKTCNDACIAEASCCTATDCAMGATCNAGMCACPAGQHLCDTACASDTSPNSCGNACMPCAAPAGGSADCVAGECTPKCPTGQKICLGSCIAEDRSCEGQCPSGTHDCSGNCVDTMSPMNCGTSCSACAVPSGGTATCNGSTCGIRCSGSLSKACTDHCAAQCCTDSDCSGNDRCVSGSCVCQKQCSSRVCGSDGCMGSCGTCPTNYTCTTAGQCDCQERCDGTRCGPNTDGCGGTCACTGGKSCISGACEAVPSVYDACTPNGGSFGPGNCSNGLFCVGVAGTGNFCYEEKTGSICAGDYFPAFNTICLKSCDPTVGSAGCPAKTHCILNGETGGTDPTVGYCVAG